MLQTISKAFIYFVLFSIFFCLFVSKFSMFNYYSYEILYISLAPWILFLISGFIAYNLKLDKKYILTICLSTGLQNISIAILIINHNFSAPESDYALTVLFSLLLIGPLPIYFQPFIDLLSIKIMNFYGCYQSSQDDDEDDYDYMIKKQIFVRFWFKVKIRCIPVDIKGI